MRRIATTILLASLFGLLAPGCSSPPAPPPTPLTVKVATVGQKSGKQALRYSGQVQAAKRVDLAFKVGGYVDQIVTAPGVDNGERPLQGGDPVRTGQPLAQLRTVDYEQKVAEAQAGLAQARSAAEQAKLDFDRTSELTKAGAATPADLDNARTKLDSNNASVAVAEARLAEAKTALYDTVLRSPLDGIVLKRSTEVGVLAAPGTIAFTVADTSSVKVVFGIPDTLLGRVHLGDLQEVSTEAFGDLAFQGRITRISPVADAKTRSFEVEVTIPNPDQKLKEGMVTNLSLSAPSDPRLATAQSVLVPLAAVVRAPANRNSFAVFVVVDEGGKSIARLRTVELGDFAGSSIPVEKGLNGGEHVVVMGAGLLSDGDLVGVVE